MAFTRAWLKSKGYEDEQIDELITAHTEVTKALKAKITAAEDELETVKSDMGDISKVKEELKKAKSDLKETNEKLIAAEKERDDYKSKSETSAADLDKLKTETATKETERKKETALRERLKSGKYSDEAVSIIFDSKEGYASSIEFDDEGKAKNIDAIIEKINAKYPSYVPKASTSGANPASPPANGGSKTAMSWEDIDKIKDDGARQTAMAQNMKALGLKK